MTASYASGEMRLYAYHVKEALLGRLPRGGPAPGMYGLLKEYPSRPAKALRPTLLMATCAALGGDQDAALDLSVGVEMLHNAFLIHDDIQDKSTQRRGGRSLHDEYGIAAALWAGDAMAVEAVSSLAEAATSCGLSVVTVLSEVQTAVRCALLGQAQELAWAKEQQATDVQATEYFAMVLRKTSWYSVILPCRLGALAAGWTPLQNRFVRFGTLLGAVLQLGDDLQGLLGTGDGDMPGRDLLEGKRSLPVIYALEKGSLAKDLRRLLQMPPEKRLQKTDEARELAARMERIEPLNRARRDAVDLAEQARAELATELVAAGPSPAAKLLDDMIDYLRDRCHGRSIRTADSGVTGSA